MKIKSFEFNLRELAGFAQIPLTAKNAVISTSSLIKKYWPGFWSIVFPVLLRGRA